MAKSKASNKWYILYTLIPILAFFGIATAVHAEPTPSEPTITIYGVKDVKSGTDFKISQLILTDGEVINNPTMKDIREHHLMSYHTQEELDANASFTTDRLN
jgi:hypothetical protein